MTRHDSPWQDFAFVASEAGSGVQMGRERVLLEKLLTPLAAVLQSAAYGASCRPLRLNAAACGDGFVMSRATRALAGAASFLRDMQVDARSSTAATSSSASVAQALPKLLVVVVSLLQARARRVHGPALALLTDVVGWLDRAHGLLIDAAQDGALAGAGVSEWKQTLCECAVATMLGVLRDASASGYRWSKEQVEALLQLLFIAASPMAAGAAEEDGEAREAAAASVRSDDDGSKCDMVAVEAVCIQVLQARLGDWWSPSALASEASTPQVRGAVDLFGPGGKEPEAKDEVEADAWLGAIAMSLQSAMASSQAGSPRRGLAQRLLTALLPALHDSVSRGPPAGHLVPAADAPLGAVSLGERVCSQFVRLLLLSHNGAHEHAKAHVLGAVVTSLLQLTPDPNAEGGDARWPPASVGAVAVKTITALAAVDTAAFRLQVAAMPPPLQLRLRCALAAAR